MPAPHPLLIDRQLDKVLGRMRLDEYQRDQALPQPTLPAPSALLFGRGEGPLRMPREQPWTLAGRLCYLHAKNIGVNNPNLRDFLLLQSPETMTWQPGVPDEQQQALWVLAALLKDDRPGDILPDQGKSQARPCPPTWFRQAMLAACPWEGGQAASMAQARRLGGCISIPARMAIRQRNGDQEVNGFSSSLSALSSFSCMVLGAPAQATDVVQPRIEKALRELANQCQCNEQLLFEAFCEEVLSGWDAVLEDRALSATLLPWSERNRLSLALGSGDGGERADALRQHLLRGSLQAKDVLMLESEYERLPVQMVGSATLRGLLSSPGTDPQWMATLLSEHQESLPWLLAGDPFDTRSMVDAFRHQHAMETSLHLPAQSPHRMRM